MDGLRPERRFSSKHGRPHSGRQPTGADWIKALRCRQTFSNARRVPLKFWMTTGIPAIFRVMNALFAGIRVFNPANSQSLRKIFSCSRSKMSCDR